MSGSRSDGAPSGLRVTVVDHPLVGHKITALRDRTTDAATFRHLCEELVTLLAFDATRALPVQDRQVSTPVAPARGTQLAGTPLIVPVLRAGIGMLSGMSRLLPTADVGFLGMVRDETSLVASTYADRLPADLGGRDVFVLDPMLATGGTLATAMRLLADRGARTITAVCLLAAPPGVSRLAAALSDLRHVELALVVAAVDLALNDAGYIVPGLGDAGDRLFGSV